MASFRNLVVRTIVFSAAGGVRGKTTLMLARRRLALRLWWALKAV